MSDITDDLIALAERAEAATGPDRGLDHEIALAKQGGALGSFATAKAWVRAATASNWNSPRFTASIDAAMQLVPEGWRWTWNGALKRAWVSSDNEAEITQHGVSAIPALALTAASLRARAAA